MNIRPVALENLSWSSVTIWDFFSLSSLPSPLSFYQRLQQPRWVKSLELWVRVINCFENFLTLNFSLFTFNFFIGLCRPRIYNLNYAASKNSGSTYSLWLFYLLYPMGSYPFLIYINFSLSWFSNIMPQKRLLKPLSPLLMRQITF